MKYLTKGKQIMSWCQLTVSRGRVRDPCLPLADALPAAHLLVSRKARFKEGGANAMHMARLAGFGTTDCAFRLRFG
jgi:hypothetical protein